MQNLRKFTRIIIFVFTLLLIGAVQIFFFSIKVNEVRADTYRQYATELQADVTWRYGFVAGHHGATLIRTRNVAEAEPINLNDIDTELSEIMARELNLVPIKTIAEFGLYLAILGFVFFIPKWLTIRLPALSMTPLWGLFLPCLIAILGWTIAICPLLFFRYGVTVYTNWVGPGALSYSGPYFGISFLQGDTISYRTFIESSALYPAIFTRSAVNLGYYFPNLTMGVFLWIAGFWFYGALGFAIGCAKLIAKSLRKPQVNHG